MEHLDKRHSHYFIISYGSNMNYGILLEDVLTEVIPETMGQFTGFYDKNGVKIFEGDIVCADGYWDIVIEFENGSFMCKALNKVQYVNKTINVPISNFDLLRLYEVIGNIHEKENE